VSSAASELSSRTSEPCGGFTTDVPAVTTLDEAKRALGRRTYDLTVADLNLAGKRDGGRQVMAAVGLLSTGAPVSVLSGFRDDANRSAADRVGMTYFFEKPADLSAVVTLATRHGVRTATNGIGWVEREGWSRRCPELLRHGVAPPPSPLSSLCLQTSTPFFFARCVARLARYCWGMTESPVALLRTHSRYAPWNARGLAAHVTALVDAAGIRPTNASARQAPSARSVRFYVANGLLDRPEGTGTSATYNYRHFLQLLAIKIRQREGATLEAIKREMHELTGDSLERRVATSLAPALGAGAAQLPRDAEGNGNRSWRRMPVADGIELHVRDDSPAAREEALMAMREAVRAALGRADIR
jgi:hypothetical protein